jgi:hypothetical protein
MDGVGTAQGTPTGTALIVVDSRGRNISSFSIIESDAQTPVGLAPTTTNPLDAMKRPTYNDGSFDGLYASSNGAHRRGELVSIRG